MHTLKRDPVWTEFEMLLASDWISSGETFFDVDQVRVDDLLGE